MHTLTPQRLQALLGSPEAQRLSAPAQERLRWIAAFVMSGDSISETCEKLGIARSTFHRWLDRFDPMDLSSLEERAHEPLHARASMVPAETIALIRAYRERSPLVGKERIRELLLSEHGLDVSASSIGRVIERECLYFGTTPLHWRKRMRRDAPATMEMPTINQVPKEATAVITNPVSPAPAASCACVWCRVWSMDGRRVRRTFAVASVLINVVMVGLFLGTVLWEKRNEPQVQAQLMSSATGEVISPSLFSLDGR